MNNSVGPVLVSCVSFKALAIDKWRLLVDGAVVSLLYTILFVRTLSFDLRAS